MDRVIAMCTPYSFSLQVSNVEPSDAGIYQMFMKRILPYEETFPVSVKQHIHSSDIDVNYGKFWVRVRTPVGKEIRIEPNEQVIIILPYFLLIF